MPSSPTKRRFADLYEHRRPHGVVVTDRKGDMYVARLGEGVEIVNGVIQAVGAGCDQLVAIYPDSTVVYVFTADGEKVCVEYP